MSLKKQFQREVKENGFKPIKGIKIVKELQNDMQNNKFLLFDSAYDDENRFVVFSAFVIKIDNSASEIGLPIIKKINKNIKT